MTPKHASKDSKKCFAAVAYSVFEYQTLQLQSHPGLEQQRFGAQPHLIFQYKQPLPPITNVTTDRQSQNPEHIHAHGQWTAVPDPARVVRLRSWQNPLLVRWPSAAAQPCWGWMPCHAAAPRDPVPSASASGYSGNPPAKPGRVNHCKYTILLP